MLFIGLDWARTKHDLIALDQKGDALLKLRLQHDPADLVSTAQKIAALEPNPTQVRVTIELHDGALLAWLLAQGYTVYGLNPKSADRAREQYRPSGGKDDATDAFVLADLTRVHSDKWRPLQPHSDTTQALHDWVRLRADLTQEKTALCQRLRAILDEWCPALSRLCDDLNRQWQQALLADFPLQQDIAAEHGNRINGWAKAHRLRSATMESLRTLRTFPVLPIPAGRQSALRFEIRHLAGRIAELTRQLDEVDAELAEQVEAHPDAAIFQSLPVKGTFTVAALLAGFGQNREDAPSWRELAARWGAAPVTVQSGKSRHVKRRRACDHTMSQVFVFFCFKTAFTAGCWAEEYYRNKRAQGTDHYATLRCLAQRWIKILHSMWLSHSQYDEAFHQKNRQEHGACAA